MGASSVVLRGFQTTSSTHHRLPIPPLPRPRHPPTHPSRQDCGRKFLDAVMTTARVELFLPKVEIVAALDHVNELYIIVAGGV